LDDAESQHAASKSLIECHLGNLCPIVYTTGATVELILWGAARNAACSATVGSSPSTPTIVLARWELWRERSHA
jgi:hypothetical protein